MGFNGEQVVFAPSSFAQLQLTMDAGKLAGLLWWPWQMGNPTLHTLALSFVADGTEPVSTHALTWIVRPIFCMALNIST